MDVPNSPLPPCRASATVAAVVSLVAAIVGCSASDSSSLDPDGGAAAAEDGSVTGQDASSSRPSRDAGGGGGSGHDGGAGPTSDAGTLPGSEGGSSGGPPAVRYIGRFDTSDPSRPTAEWSGSAMEANFSGTSVSAKLSGKGTYYAVVIDGVVGSVVVTDGSGTYSLATGLSDGPHHVLVYRRDEAGDGPTVFGGFDFGGGQLLSPPATPSRRIEVIGDSISAAYGDECTSSNQHFSPDTQNEYIAYGPLTGRALGADVHVVAWSGKGMYQNYDGTRTDTMPELWQRTLPVNSSSHWDPSQWIPDAVVIALGGNDYEGNGGDPGSAFQSAYQNFVETIRTAYPNATLFLCVGPMVNDPQRSEIRTAVKNVISTRQSAGDTKLQMVEFPEVCCGCNPSNCGCDTHPNAAQQQAMATQLQDALHTALGW